MIRVPGRVVDYLLETQCAYDMRAGDRHVRDADDLVDTIRAVTDASTNADGSRSIEVSDDRLDVLATYGDYLATSAADNAGDGDMSALADVNAGRAMQRRVYAIRSRT